MAAAQAFNRLSYDVNTYQFDVQQSVGPGAYSLGTPMPHCQPCFASDTRIHLGTSGGADCTDRPLVDIGSELMGISRRATNSPTGKYFPGRGDCGAVRQHPDCRSSPETEDTRLSNPPCTLRGTGWNRWQWLCQDPQQSALIPFDWNISNRLVVKDNHRPHIATPLDPRVVLPSAHDTPAAGSQPVASAPCQQADAFPAEPTQMHWRTCGELRAIGGGCPRAAGHA